MKYLIAAILVGLAGYAGYKLGQRSITNRLKRAAATFLDECAKLAEQIKAIPMPQPVVPRPTPQYDTLAGDIVPILKRGDVDKALAHGDIALFYPRDGNA